MAVVRPIEPSELLVLAPAGVHRGQNSDGSLTRCAPSGAGVALGAVIRVFALPGLRVFRLIVALVLPLQVWRCARPVGQCRQLSRRGPLTTLRNV